MELRPHYRVVRFSPAPEYLEPVNVALLICDSKPRLVSDFNFEKLKCIAPFFETSLLRVWLESVAQEISHLQATDIASRISSKSAQIRLGRERYLDSDVPTDVEARLIGAYLRKSHRHARQSDDHASYVDSLIANMLGNSALLFGDVLKRAKPEQYLRAESVKLLSAKNIRLSRVLRAPRALILMDGLNLAIANRSQLRQRATDIDFSFYTFGEVKRRLESIEEREIVRTSFLFNRPTAAEREIDYLTNLVQRNADYSVDSSLADEVFRFNTLIRSKSST